MKQAKAYEIIKQLRQKRGLSQKDLADKVGMTQQSIALLENGKRKLEFDLFVEMLNKMGATNTELTEIINSVFSQSGLKELKTLADLENFFCYLESLGYKISVSDYAEMKKLKITPHGDDDYLVGIQDNNHDNVTFFHKKDFIEFQNEVAKTIDYEIYKQFKME